MKQFQILKKYFHKKPPSQLLFPLYALCGLLLVIGIYRLHDSSLQHNSSSHTSSQSAKQTSQESEFLSYLDKIFQAEVTSNTLNLHYTLADPASADLTDYPVTLGEISARQESAQLASLENMKQELHSYDPSKMSVSCRLTYDVLEDSINRSMAMAPYYYFTEPLSSTGGVQSEYPILLAEYTFHSKKDIEDYLQLLAQFDTYFQKVCLFEKEKAKRGLFMNQKAVDNVITQCRAFIPEDSADSFWETTFQERLVQMKELTAQEKKSYINRNHELLQEHVYPAYHNLIANLKALKKEDTNNQGLCYFQDGKKYYTMLVKSTTGSDRTVPELQNMVEKQRSNHLAELTRLTSEMAEDAFSANLLPFKTPEEMLDHLKQQIASSFPVPPEANCSIKQVNKKLQDFLSPAFYLTSPMDHFTENCIYINPGNRYNEIELFTTLAHEGYPGHLYQTIYSYSAQLPPIRYILYHGGYTEGWATYVEMLSYAYAGIDQTAAQALMLNQDATLSLYATIDMGVHYDGWSLADTVDFLADYGITESAVISKIYQAIIENPANYLKYYIGYLEFLNLKEQAKTYYKNDYSDLLYHTAVLNMGSAPFYILEKYFVKYYKAAK